MSAEQEPITIGTRVLRRIAEYEITVDLLSQVAGTSLESDVVHRVFELFDQLCSPAWIRYLPIRDGILGSATTFVADGTQEGVVASVPAIPDSPCAIADSGRGFVLRISRRSEPLALVEVEGMASADHLEDYLDLAPSIADVLALAIHNARIAERLERLSITDELTGIPNRRAGMDSVVAEFGRARRANASIAVIVLDLDAFKAVNDEHGYVVGDLVLKEVALRLKSAVRIYDVVARIGGEEFLVLAPGADLLGALALAERITALIADTAILIDGAAVSVSVSAGVAAIRDDDDGADDMLARADLALTTAKRADDERIGCR